jgi:hypothetical protein
VAESNAMTQLKTLSSTNPKLAMHTTYKDEIIASLPTFTPFLNVQPQKFTQKNFSPSEPIGETIPCSILPNFPLGKAKKKKKNNHQLPCNHEQP